MCSSAYSEGLLLCCSALACVKRRGFSCGLLFVSLWLAEAARMISNPSEPSIEHKSCRQICWERQYMQNVLDSTKCRRKRMAIEQRISYNDTSLTDRAWASSVCAVAWNDSTSKATLCLAISWQAFSYIWQLWMPSPVKMENACTRTKHRDTDKPVTVMTDTRTRRSRIRRRGRRRGRGRGRRREGGWKEEE